MSRHDARTELLTPVNMGSQAVIILTAPASGVWRRGLGDWAALDSGEAVTISDGLFSDLPNTEPRGAGDAHCR